MHKNYEDTKKAAVHLMRRAEGRICEGFTEEVTWEQEL